MKILVACEMFGVVRDEFAKNGHDVTSCDILDTVSPGKHYKGDVMEILNDGWDMMICFPPCNDISASGARLWPLKQADGRQQKAIDFALCLYNSNIPKVSLESSVGILSTVWRKPDQVIQPFYFGDPWRKTTCLWLKNLPNLVYTDIVTPVGSWIDNTRSGARKDGTRKQTDRVKGMQRDPKLRAKTFLGVAQAMANQWG